MEKKNRLRAKGIAEAYIHVHARSNQLDHKNNLTQEKALSYIQDNANQWVQEFYGKKATTQIKVEEGSIKAWVLVTGMSIFEIVSNYGSFRSGIDQIVDDSQAFSEYVFNNFIQDENITDDMLIRQERRLGIPGKIQRFLKKTNKLNTAITIQERNELINTLSEELTDIISLLDNETDRDILKNNSPEIIVENLPENIPMPIPEEHYESYTLLHTRENDEQS